MSQIIYALVANGRFILVAHQTKDGNMLQYAKRIISSGIEEEGDHNRCYYDKSGDWVFHVLVADGISFLCFARQSLSPATALDFLNAVADSFFDLYNDYLDDVDPEIFQDYQAPLSQLMVQFGAGVVGAGPKVEPMMSKPFCGMRDSTGALLKTSTDVAIKVTGPTMKVVVSCDYENKTKVAKDVVFSFKQESGVTVGFQVSRGDDQPELYTVTEELQSIPLNSTGQFGFLLEELDDHESFNARLGTVNPGERVWTTLTYVSVLEMEQGALVIEMPLTQHYGVCLSFQATIELEMATKILEIECPSGHEVTVDYNDRFAEVMVMPDSVYELESSLTLFVVLEDCDKPILVAERALDDSDPHAMSLCLGWAPSFQSEPFQDTTLEHVFICDRSTGMKGRKIKRLRSALRLWLHSLPPRCAFNIIGVGASIVKLYSQSEILKDDTLRQALQHVESIEADLGGGSVAPALHYALTSAPQDAGKPRQFYLVMSEGLEGTAERVMPAVLEAAQTSRIFTFCIGPNSNQILARKIARGANGICEYLPSDQNLEEAVVDRVHRGWNPVVCARVSWGAAAALQHPQAPPPVFYGSFNFFLVYAVLRDEPQGTVLSSSLQGFSPMCSADGLDSRQPVQESSGEVRLREVRPDNAISLNMQVHRLRLLEARYRRSQSPETRALLLELSAEANVPLEGVTQCTLLDAQTGLCHASCHVIARRPQSSSYAAGPAGASELEVRVACKPTVPQKKPEKPGGGGLFGRLASYLGNKDAAESADLAPFLGAPLAGDLLDFVDLQRADGRWIHDAIFAQVVSASGHLGASKVHDVPGAVRSVFPEATLQLDAWATVIGVAVLECAYAEEEQWWMLVSLKAKNWLLRAIQRNSKGAPLETIHAQADRLLSIGSTLVGQRD